MAVMAFAGVKNPARLGPLTCLGVYRRQLLVWLRLVVVERAGQPRQPFASWQVRLEGLVTKAIETEATWPICWIVTQQTQARMIQDYSTFYRLLREEDKLSRTKAARVESDLSRVSKAYSIHVDVMAEMRVNKPDLSYCG
jgi:hypothetical protein